MKLAQKIGPGRCRFLPIDQVWVRLAASWAVR